MNDLIGGPQDAPDLQMVHQEFVASIDRLMCDELDLDQLETVSRILADVATTYDPNLVRAKAAHYDGLFRGVMAYRKRERDGALTPPTEDESDAFPVPTMWSHPPEGRLDRSCERCGLSDHMSEPHRRWFRGEYGVGPDGV